jgi:hypothetical protein
MSIAFMHSLAYLNAALMDDEDPKIFLIALRNVLEAHGSISKGKLADKKLCQRITR